MTGLCDYPIFLKARSELPTRYPVNYMNKALFLAILFTVTIGLSPGAIFGQENPADENQSKQENSQPANQPMDNRTNILRQLGLSREQIQQIRRINTERKPLMEAAQKRMRDATRALDAVIYADQIVETDVRDRLKDLQLAQAEVSKVRFMNEVAVRRILTPEQLIRFRELRKRFEQMRENIDERRNENRTLPFDVRRPFQNEQRKLDRVQGKAPVKPTI